MAQNIDTGLMLRMEASLSKFEKQMAKATQVGTGAATNLEKRFDTMSSRMKKSAADSASVFTSHFDKIDAKYKSLASSVDPAAAAGQRLAQSEKTLSDALNAGTISAREHARVLALVRDQYAKTVPNAANLASGIGRVTQIGGAGRFVLQNTAAQIGDMAVQMEMGTSASRILSQQLPQLFGGFGALGGALGIVAPLLGTVAAVGIPLAAMFFTLGSEAEDADEKVKTFAEKLDMARGALSRAEAALASASAGGIEDLRKKYGEVTVAVSELSDALAEIEKRAARLEIGNFMDDLFDDNYASQIGKLFGAVGEALVGATDEQIEDAKRQIADAQADIAARQSNGIFVSQAELDDLALMKNELAVLQGDLANAGTLAGEIRLPPALLTDIAAFENTMRNAIAAGDFDGARDAIEGMRRGLVDAGLTVEDDLLRRVVEVEDIVREAANRFSDAEGNANGVADASTRITSEVGNAADEAARLNGNLAGALAQLAGITKGIATANRLASQAAQRRIDYAGDPVGLAGAETRGQMQEDTGALAYAAIRNGSTSTLSQIESDTNSLAAGARAAAELEENAKAAEKAAADAIKAANGTGSKKSGGTKSKKSGKEETPFFETVERDIAALERQIEMVGKSKAEVAELTARYALLDEAKKRGIVVTDELSARIDAEAAHVGTLAGQYEQAQDQMAALEQLNQQWKDSLIDAAMGVEGAFEGVINAIKRAAIEYALFGSGTFANIGGGGGGFGGLMSGASKLFSFDGGGNTGSGPRSGGLDGKGGFMAMLHPRETIVDHTKGQSVGGGGGGAMHVTVGVSADNNGNLMPFVQSVTQRGVQQGMGQIRREMPGVMDRYRKETA